MPTYFNSLNAGYIEGLEEQYRTDPSRLEPSWRFFFDGLSVSRTGEAPAEISPEKLEFEIRVLELIQGYREMGHLIADVNPLDRGVKTHPLLDLSNFGLKEQDLDRICQIGQVLGFGSVTLRQIVKSLQAYYCSPVAVEYGHIDEPVSRHWIQTRVESDVLSRALAPELKLRALQKLVEAKGFEEFLHHRFVGQKRFSIEGIEVLIPMLDFLIDEATRLGADEIIVGMAHRGRLNVLANVFQKDLRVMLAEFSGHLDAEPGDGDVKYHMGFSQNTVSASGKPVHLSLMPNPSHLEAVDPVLMGVTRAKQRLKKDWHKNKTLAVLIHGEAAFAGQGVIYETLNLSDLAGYSIGGTVHILMNNQIGYTTTPEEGRSTPNATDIAKMLEFPIFRVNGDEIEAAIRCMDLALDFRYEFKRDVVIDVMGYRLYGHNEGDEPSFTQPLLYRKIESHPSSLEIYARQAARTEGITLEQIEAMKESYARRLDEALSESKAKPVSPKMHAFGDRWEKLVKPTEKNVFHRTATGVSVEKLKAAGARLLEIPPGFRLHPKLRRNFEERRGMADGTRDADWSMAEAWAFATLLMDGYSVRLAGQDSERGTFSQRHAVLHDFETGEKFTPLNHLKDVRGDFEVVNSPLSEYAAMGFEFGHSLADPMKLTLWEAQYGDFVNGAQIMVDQFVTTSAFKWQRHSGLTLLLPHGFEGQGPEHSSARLERFLQACAQNNIQVVNLTTPAQYFHALRRQMLRPVRLPLVVMTPKSLLRHPLVISKIADFQDEQFHEFLDETESDIRARARRVVLCSGKVYYDLVEARKKQKHSETAIVRVEQFYPFAKDRLAEILGAYKGVKDLVWCQEGPQNTEGWGFMLQTLPSVPGVNLPLRYVGRPPQASPTDGYLHLHLREQKKIIHAALGES
jgi:2-oxoglutarate dehydrogenase E1 component